jgi:PPOX class probable F420-dependent enzyme
MIDLSSREGQRAAERLRKEVVIWLTTVSPAGKPQSSPVWFLWDGETFLIYSRPESPKVPNIRANPRVSLNLDGNTRGGEIVTIEGVAEVMDESGDHPPEYVDKYRESIADLGWNPESFAGDYSTGIRITPRRVRVY